MLLEKCAKDPFGSFCSININYDLINLALTSAPGLGIWLVWIQILICVNFAFILSFTKHGFTSRKHLEQHSDQWSLQKSLHIALWSTLFFQFIYFYFLIFLHVMAVIETNQVPKEFCVICKKEVHANTYLISVKCNSSESCHTPSILDILDNILQHDVPPMPEQTNTWTLNQNPN